MNFYLKDFLYLTDKKTTTIFHAQKENCLYFPEKIPTLSENVKFSKRKKFLVITEKKFFLQEWLFCILAQFNWVLSNLVRGLVCASSYKKKFIHFLLFKKKFQWAVPGGFEQLRFELKIQSSATRALTVNKLWAFKSIRIANNLYFFSWTEYNLLQIKGLTRKE